LLKTPLQPRYNPATTLLQTPLFSGFYRKEQQDLVDYCALHSDFFTSDMDAFA
jgi:hypothetical protein